MHHGPFEFRILKQMPSNVRAQIAKPFRDLIGWTDIVLQEEGEEKEKNKLKQKIQGIFSIIRQKTKGYSPHFKNMISKLVLTPEALDSVKFPEFFNVTGLYLLD